MADPNVFVSPPRREPRRGGIKSLGAFVRTERLGAAARVEYISEGCTFAALAPGLCWGTVITEDKTPDGIDTLTSIATIFGQYAGVECFLGVDSEADYRRRAENLLEASEAHEVEAVLRTWADGAAVGGTGTDITEAIALAEEQADQFYIGGPVLLMSRANAVRASADGSVTGNREGEIWTIHGTPVIASWVVPEDAIYAIGMPTVYVSDVTTTVANDLTTNREMAIAERLYGVVVDCDYRNKISIGVV